MRRSWVALVLLLTACPRDDAPRSEAAEAKPSAPKLETLEVAARPGAGSPRLTTGPEGLVLSWIEPDGDALRLRAQPWRGDAETLLASEQLLQNWADMPSVLALPQAWIAAWPQRRDDGYDLRWATRTAPGRWDMRGPVSDATAGPEFGFVSFAVGESGTATAFWLDGRGSTTSHGGAMQLWTAAIGPDGIADRRVVDDRVCDCCQTAAAATPRGPVVAYRDRSDAEIRDIWLAGPSPEQRRRVGNDDWMIEGCPVNGPSVVATGDAIAVAWFSAAASPGHVSVAFARGDAPFSSPVQVDEGAPVGRVDIAWLDETSAAVVWLERTSAGADIRLRRVSVDGARSPAITVAPTDASRTAGFPQLERTGDQLALAWVGVEGPGSIRAAELPVASVPR